MARRLYIGNLSYNSTEDTLRDAFDAFGTLKYVKVITDRETGKSKGFGFVEYATDEEGATAMNTMNGTEVDGRKLIVNEAKEKTPR
jgi:RNA recognition motif-containing protein